MEARENSKNHHSRLTKHSQLLATDTYGTYEAPCGLEISITRYVGNLGVKSTAETALRWSLTFPSAELATTHAISIHYIRAFL